VQGLEDRIELSVGVANFYQQYDKHELTSLDTHRWAGILSDSHGWKKQVEAQYKSPYIADVPVSERPMLRRSDILREEDDNLPPAISKTSIDDGAEVATVAADGHDDSPAHRINSKCHQSQSGCQGCSTRDSIAFGGCQICRREKIENEARHGWVTWFPELHGMVLEVAPTNRQDLSPEEVQNVVSDIVSAVAGEQPCLIGGVSVRTSVTHSRVPPLSPMPKRTLKACTRKAYTSSCSEEGASSPAQMRTQPWFGTDMLERWLAPTKESQPALEKLSFRIFMSVAQGAKLHCKHWTNE
jgi:hypothetical protein